MTVAEKKSSGDVRASTDAPGLPPLAPAAAYQPWRFLYRLPLLILWLLALPILFVALLPGVRSLPLGEGSLGGRVQQGYAVVLTRTLGLRLQVVGDLPEAPFLLAANHISWFDIVLLHAMAPIWLVAKSGIRDWPLIGTLAHMAGTVFIERGREDSRRRTARRMAALLRRGHIVGLFPEAGIDESRGVGRFHARLFAPAQRAGVPVLPVAIRYWRNGDAHNERVFGPGQSMLRLALSNLARPPCQGQLLLGSLLMPDSERSTLARQAQASVQQLYGQANV